VYTPRHFEEHELSALDALIAADAFVTVVHQHEGAPYASHLPVLYRRDGAAVELRGHWSRANPQWRSIIDQQVLVIVHGPHAYVSPTWYTAPEQSVPTWNYVTAHIYGHMQVDDDPGSLESIVTELAELYERKHDSNWRFDQVTTETRRDLRGIVGFRFTAERIELKFKLNQNHPLANRLGVVTALERIGGDDRNAIAALMRERIAKESANET